MAVTIVIETEIEDGADLTDDVIILFFFFFFLYHLFLLQKMFYSSDLGEIKFEKLFCSV
jgi:hypothetical protein